jgi:hypothetical protein
MMCISFRIRGSFITWYLNSFTIVGLTFILNLLLISSTKKLKILYFKSRTKRKPETEIQGSSIVWNSRGGTDILSYIPKSMTIYELTSPRFNVIVYKFLNEHGLKRYFKRELTVINRELFLYIMVQYNDGIEPFLINGFNAQLHSVLKFTALIISTVLKSSIIIVKYKNLLSRLNPIFLGLGLSITLVLGGIKICDIKCSDLYYPKQAE